MFNFTLQTDLLVTIKLQYTVYNDTQYEAHCNLNLGQPLIASSGLWNSSLQDTKEDGPDEEEIGAVAAAGHFHHAPNVYGQLPYHTGHQFPNVPHVHTHMPQYNQAGTLYEQNMINQQIGLASGNRICHPVEEDQPDQFHQAYPNQQYPGYLH